MRRLDSNLPGSGGMSCSFTGSGTNADTGSGGS